MTLFLIGLIGHVLFSPGGGHSLQEKYTEKVFLQVKDNKDTFSKGERAYFQIYLVDGASHAFVTKSRIVYVDVLDSQYRIIDTKTYKVTNSLAFGSFEFPRHISEGKYLIRAYTNYMRNFDPALFFQKTIWVKNKKESGFSKRNMEQMVFRPEGGNLIASHLNHVGIRVMDARNRGIALKGKIVDKKGDLVTDFSTTELGIGMLKFIPEWGNEYRALISTEGKTDTYKLPTPVNRGYMVQLSEMPTHYRLLIKSIGKGNLRGKSLSIHQREGLFYNAIISNDMEATVLKIPKEIFQMGAMKVVLSNEEGRPLLYRVHFHGDKGGNFDFLSKKEDNHLTFAQDANGGMETVAISVRTENSAPHKNWDGILPYLLFASDYQRPSDFLPHFPRLSNPNWENMVNALMITLEGEKLIFAEKWNGKSNKMEYSPEIGCTVIGKVKDAHGLGVMAQVSLTYQNSMEVGTFTKTTDSLGNFVFENCDFGVRTDVFLKAGSLSSNIGSASLVIDLESNEVQPVVHNLNVQYDSLHIKTGDVFYLPSNTVALEEVVVEEDAIAQRQIQKNRRRMLYKEPSGHLDFRTTVINPNENVLEALAGRVPGIRISRGVNGSVVPVMRGASSFSGSRAPLVLLDGTPVFFDAVSQLIPDGIDFIDVLTGPRAAIYGGRAANGVIAIYSRQGDSGKKIIRITNSNTYKTIFEDYKELKLTSNKEIAKLLYRDSTSASQFFWFLPEKDDGEKHTKTSISRTDGNYETIMVRGIVDDRFFEEIVNLN